MAPPRRSHPGRIDATPMRRRALPGGVSGDVRLRGGVEVTFASRETIVCDGGGDGAATVLSHAHGDHLVRGRDGVVASELTAALAGVRRSADPPEVVAHDAVTLHDAGHVPGSRAAELTDPETGRTYLYTGDCCTRDRFFLDGFEPVPADVLVVETTYGEPAYRFPPTDEVVAEVHDWLADTMDQVVVCFGYSLGRAQTVQRVLANSTRDRVLVTDDVASVNEVVAGHLEVSFPAERHDGDVDVGPGDALVVPAASTRRRWFESLVERHDVATAGFSGWAVDDSFVYRRGVDEGFVLSDHCDFDELVALVRAVDPERVYTTHGATDAFARYLTSEHGYETRALKAGQTTLADF
jgi:putative mRNA 3-end processing factor